MTMKIEGLNGYVWHFESFEADRLSVLVIKINNWLDDMGDVLTQVLLEFRHHAQLFPSNRSHTAEWRHQYSALVAYTTMERRR